MIDMSACICGRVLRGDRCPGCWKGTMRCGCSRPISPSIRKKPETESSDWITEHGIFMNGIRLGRELERQELLKERMRAMMKHGGMPARILS